MSEDTVPATLEGIAAALAEFRREVRREFRGIDNRLAALEGAMAGTVKLTRFEVHETQVRAGFLRLAEGIDTLEATLIGLGKQRDRA
jgi:hypothetical protein